MPAADLSAGLQRDIPAIAVRKYEKRGIYIDYAREKIHVMWAVGHEDAEGVFVQHGPQRIDYIVDVYDEDGQPVAGEQYYSQFIASQQARDVLSIVAAHERSIGNL